MTTAYRTCPLCEATCGLKIELDDDGAVTDVRGDPDDVFSRGYLCPKGASFGRVEDDPDRLTAPMIRVDGELVPTDWDTAFARIDALLTPILECHGRDAVATYVGNPSGHNVAYPLYQGQFIAALGSSQRYAPSTMDQMPVQVVARLLYGHMGSIPVPDIDRTDLLFVVGGNPLVSNGSVATAPDWRGRIKAMQARGGRLVVVDPVRTTTAKAADVHVAPRPGTDALLLLAMVHVLVRDDLVSLGEAEGRTSGLDDVRDAVAAFTPERVADHCGVTVPTIEDLAHRLATAPSAAVYGRLGSSLTSFGTLTTWALHLLGALTGNLDRPGGTMFTTPAAGSPTTRAPSTGKPARFGAWHSRVRGFPEILGELPVACLAEEILTPGDDRVRALVVLAGNPARSFPSSESVDEALGTLDALVCVDPYLNETTARADVVLPAAGALTREHFDLVLYQYALRNVANYSPPARELPDGMLEEWRIMLRLAGIVAGQGPDVDTDAADRALAEDTARRAARAQDLDPEEVVGALTGHGPSRLIDLRLRTGPYGDHYGRHPDGLSLDRLRAAPHGIDLGPLRSRLSHALHTPSGTVELAPEWILADLPRLAATLDEPPHDGVLLVGRRDLRSKNSWLHNIESLSKGERRSALHLHPDDAERYGVVDGGLADVTSRAGTVRVEVSVTDSVAPGVCSLPHGWGHDEPRSRLRVAQRRPGTNSNVLSDDTVLDPLSGTVALNAIPVVVAGVATAARKTVVAGTGVG